MLITYYKTTYYIFTPPHFISLKIIMAISEFIYELISRNLTTFQPQFFFQEE